MALYDTNVEVKQNSLANKVLAAADRHSKTIIIVCSVMIIAMAAVLADVMLTSRRFSGLRERLERLLTPSTLEKEKGDFMGSELYADYLYKLGTLYYEYNELVKAKETFEELVNTFPNSQLRIRAAQVHKFVVDDLRFLNEEKNVYLEKFYLSTHPFLQSVAESDIYSPSAMKLPLVSLEFEKGTFDFDLFVYETPEACRTVMELLGKKDAQSRVQVEISDGYNAVVFKEKPAKTSGMEKSYRRLKRGSVALLVENNEVTYGRIVFVADPRKLSDKTLLVIGQFSEFADTGVLKDSAVKSVKITK